MPKISINPAPTFKKAVPVPDPGNGFVDVVLTFKHRSKKAMDEFIASVKERSDVENFMAMVVGWELEDEFNLDNVTALLDGRMGTSVSAFETYVNELTKFRKGN